MAGLLILIAIALCFFGGYALYAVGAFLLSLFGMAKPKPKPLTKFDEQELLQSYRIESDYKSDREFFKYLPKSDDGEPKGKIEILPEKINTPILIDETEYSAVRTFIWKMADKNPLLFSAMKREARAAEAWMEAKKKCYYPTSYMHRTFEKYGVYKKLHELEKIGCVIPTDFRPCAPGRSNREEKIIEELKSKREWEIRDYESDKGNYRAIFWCTLGAILVFIAAPIGIWLMYENKSDFHVVIGGILGVAAPIFGGISFYIISPLAEKNVSKNKKDKNDKYPGL